MSFGNEEIRPDPVPGDHVDFERGKKAEIEDDPQYDELKAMWNAKLKVDPIGAYGAAAVFIKDLKKTYPEMNQADHLYCHILGGSGIPAERPPEKDFPGHEVENFIRNYEIN